MKPRAIIFDLDGTLCELSDSSNPYNHDWEEVIIPEMHAIYESLMYDYPPIILTGRKRKEYWEITEEWLENNAFPHIKLIMQEKSMADKNHIFKKEKLIELQEEYDIICMFDDNELMVPVCKELGILLLQVHA